MKNLTKIKAIFTVAAVVLSSSTLAADKTFNLSVNPLGIIFGVYSIDGSVKLADKLSAGLSGNYANIKINSVRLTGAGIGVRADYAINGSIFTDCAYMSPQLKYSHISSQVNDLYNRGQTTTAKLNTISAGLVLGYQWFWDSGFNIRVGAGPAYVSSSANSGADEYNLTSSVNGVTLIGDLLFGFAF